MVRCKRTGLKVKIDRFDSPRYLNSRQCIDETLFCKFQKVEFDGCKEGADRNISLCCIPSSKHIQASSSGDERFPDTEGS